MFRFMLALLLLGCGLTGYRLIGQEVPIPEMLPLALAEPNVDAAAGDLTVSEATPTVASIFRAQRTNAVTATPKANQPSPVALGPTPQAASPTALDAKENRQRYPEFVIYDDNLQTSWTVEQSAETTIDLAEISRSFQSLDLQQEHTSGATTIAVSPQADYGTLFFTVRPDSTMVYKRQDVLGLSLWLNSGNAGIGPNDLAISILGSNAVPYWMPNDQSVFPNNTGKFSETRLYDLKVNRIIPPNTWINLVVWLNDLQYDPFYEYVTGFYIKNDAEFRSTYYLDQVTLLLAP